MSDWDPALYRQFEDERTRPAHDLLARVPLASVSTAVDLGCGPGNSTELLTARYPGASVVGVDSSEAMLAEGQARLPSVRFERADIATWAPAAAPDLVYANASLQWVPDHARLLPRLLNLLAPGGVLAFQVPDNLDEPSHATMRAVAGEDPWREHLAHAAASRVRILGAAGYYDLLTAAGASVDVWRTVYHHPMASPDAIATWLRSTGLRPFLEPLGEAGRRAFLARYTARLDAAYPARADGRRLLAFPRLFVVARRNG